MLERHDHVPLLVRCHPAKDAVVLEHFGQLMGVLPQLLDEQDEGIRKEVWREVGITVDAAVRVCEQ